MKKLFALLLCCALLVSLLAACIKDTPESETPATPSDIETEAPEEHDHEHINYKGLATADFTLDDVIAAEGREPDFSFEVGETTYYAYNDVALGDLTFAQVQFSFTDTGNHISCTCKYKDDPASVLDQIRTAMAAEFGEPSGGNNSYSWYDGHVDNHLRLSVLNDDTIQLAFDIAEGK